MGHLLVERAYTKVRLKKNVPRQTSLAQQRASNIASNIAHRLLHVCPCLIGAAGCVLCVIGGALFVTTNKLSVADLSRNEEGVVKNNFCTRKQLEITISFVSLFGGHIVLFPFLSTAMCVKDNADAVLRRRHLPHPGVLHGHGPRPRAQRHAASYLYLQRTLLTVAWTWCHHHSASPSPSSDM